MYEEFSFKKHAFLFAMILLLAIVGMFVSDVYLPSMPAIAQDLNTTETLTELTVGYYFMGFTFAQLFYGPISDSYGRKPILLFGLLVFVLGSVLCAQAQSIDALLDARIIQGIGASSCIVLTRTLIRDFFTGKAVSAFSSYMGAVIGWVPPSAPLVGAYLEHHFGWRSTFEFVVAFTVLVTVLVVFKLPESLPKERRIKLELKQVFKNYASLLKHKKFMAYTLISSLLLGAIFAYATASPFLLQERLGVSVVVFGWLGFLTGPAMAVGAMINGRSIKKFGMDRTLGFGVSIYLGAALLMLALAMLHIFTVWSIILPMSVLMFGAGMIFANAFAGAFEPFRHIAGLAGALYGCIQNFAAFGASVLLAHMHNENQMPLAVMWFALAAVTFCVYQFMIREKG